MGPWIAANGIALLLAVLIGLVTAWSIRGRKGASEEETEAEVDYDGLDRGPSFTPPADMPAADMPPSGEPAEAPDTLPPAAPAGAAVAAEPAPHDVIDIDELPSGPDNLQMIKGIGPKLSQQLQALGITSFAQIAAWTEEDIATLDPQLEGFSGRIERDDWVGQARQLARGFADEGSTFGAH